MLAMASWDESDPIIVDLGARRFEVSLELDGVRGWTAKVRETSTEAAIAT